MREELRFWQKAGAPTTRGLSECKVRQWMGEGARAERERDLKLHGHGGVEWVGTGRIC